ncbi:MAG: extracellular solute-binding protein [Deltaproteobacteria bacterium]|nr:extracellular solute-binding protein [Deltaproteobacteria bacterium]
MVYLFMMFLGWLFFLCSLLQAQESPIEKIRRLPPKEREARLIEGAKREGEVMWYGNWERDELEQLARSFKKKYPFINVSIFRGGSGKVEDKVVTEYRAGRYLVDILIAGTGKMLPFRERGIIAPYLSPEVANMHPALYDKEGWWASLASSPVVIGYNSDRITAQEAPKEWVDLLEPKWRGKIALDTEPDVMITGLLQAWGEEKTLKFLRALAQNQPQIRSGHTLLVQLLSAGEFPIAAEVYGYRMAQFIAKGAPIRMVYPKPTIFTTSPVMMAKNPPHPYTAALFYDSLLSEEGQTVVGIDIGRVPGRKQAKSRNPEFTKIQDSDRFLPLDPALVGKRTNDAQRWIKEIFLRR